jgi:threonine/homoserine/homoserine lactone efflux protein
MNQLLVFVGVSLVVIVVPGPDTALVLRSTLRDGRVAGLFSALGIAAGQTFWALMTSLGITAFLLASQPVFAAIKIAGAAYLVYLGARSLITAVRGVAAAPANPTASTAAPRSALRAFRQGVLSDLGNPKIGVFFTSLLPQLVPNHEATFVLLFSLGIIFAVLTAAWLTLYVFATEAFRRLLLRARIRQWIEGVTGAVLVGVGISVAVESTP